MTSTLKETIFNKRLLICVFSGFSSGLPLYILISLLPAWLRTEGVNLKSIGLFSLISLPFTWKFLWAPIFDRYSLPLGRRRGWLCITQLALLVSLPLLGMLSPQLDIWSIAYLSTIVAFFSASQDIVLDAYRRELLPDAELGLGNVIHVNAYKIAGLVPGSLSFILADHLPWNAVFFITALFMLPGLVMTLLVDEPALRGSPPKTLQEAVVQPFKEFIGRHGWHHAGVILAFIFLYKLGDSMATALATPFYLDMGFSKTEIGIIAKNAGLWSSVAGGILGGIWMLKLGTHRALMLFGIAQAAAILGFAWLAHVGHDPLSLAIVIAAEAFGVGLGTAAFVAYIAQTTHPLYTATQFALFTSLAAVPRTLANAATGYMVDRIGWLVFFVVCFVLALPGLALIRWLPYEAREPNQT